jgi:hypothetical protein
MSNKAMLEKAYRRWHDTKGGSVQELIDIFAEDARFGSLAEGTHPVAFTARVESRVMLKNYFDGLISQWSMIHYTVDHMIEEGDRIAVICSTGWKNKATGKTVETPKVDVWRFDKSGRAASFYEYYDTAKMYAGATP